MKKVFEIIPQNLDECIKLSQMMAKSNLVPKSFKNNPSDIFMIINLGAELGYKPFQSILQLESINGKLTLKGDAMKALIIGHPDCDDIIETYDPVTMTATCVVKRKGKSDCVKTFSKEDAQKAGLWERSIPWRQYPERMLMYRARGFALRDQFGDVLNGVISKEEAMDYNTNDTQHTNSDKSNVVEAKSESVTNDNLANFEENEINVLVESLLEDLIYKLEQVNSYESYEDIMNYIKSNKDNMLHIKENFPEESKNISNKLKQLKEEYVND